MKRKAGYSQEEIDRTRYALEGVLVPMTARWNEALLAQGRVSSDRLLLVLDELCCLDGGEGLTARYASLHSSIE